MLDVIIYVSLSLATYRLSVLFTREDGPLEIFAKFRHFIGVRYDEYSNPYGKNVIARLFTCVWCISFWFGLIFATVSPTSTTILLYFCTALAFSAVAIIVDSVTSA